MRGKNSFSFKCKYKLVPSPEFTFTSYIFNDTSYNHSNRFVFLNKEKVFSKIDWNFDEYGKLWNYNLNYFDFLQQNCLDKNTGLELINDFIEKFPQINNGREPYPTSLRVINWIKFISKNKVSDDRIDCYLSKQSYEIINNLEYHLLGNHLLENAFALLFLSYYFKDEKIYKKSKAILIKELNEQILKDGGHFELSPMYHSIILFRILDCINLLKSNDWIKDDLLEFIVSKSEKMLSWLNIIVYSDGTFPMLNDSSCGVAHSSDSLFNYARNMGLDWKNLPLGESGYRKWKNDSLEIILDVGNIGPDYIPGHAHADTFSFELRYNGEPIIVDPGVSTYEIGLKRIEERSTSFHNTIMVNCLNSSSIWGGFRVADRAKIVNLYEKNKSIEASHNGFKSIKSIHTRNFSLNDNKFEIRDSIAFKKKYINYSFLHFHPNCNLVLKEKMLIVNNRLFINFVNYRELELKEYDFPCGFNSTKKAMKIIGIVDDISSVEIKYEN